jgi:hypothetical protein
VDKRFERVYVAGKKYIRKRPDICGNTIETIDFPLGKYIDGNMRVLSVKKII